MKNIKKAIFGAAALGAAGEYALACYFFRRTMLRQNAKRGRTMDMSGTNWDLYIPKIHEDKAWVKQQPQEDVFVTSHDHLKLHGTFFPCPESKRAVICFHGYTSEGLNDYSSIAKFYREQGFNLLIIDERAHGQSEGTYIGFGCLDRLDALVWIQDLVKRLGEDCQIMLHGISMGAATVLMATGLSLPPQVKAAVSDCAFTSAYEVFQSVLKTMYHLPSFPLMNISDRMAKRKAGYGLNECNAKQEVSHSHTPTLFIHGDKDTFVPCSMVYDLYDACSAEKERLIIPGASHAEAYYKDPAAYEGAILKMIQNFFPQDSQAQGCHPGTDV